MRTLTFSNLPIRLQLIALAILLMLPALGIIVYVGVDERNNDYHKAVIETQRLADHLAAEQENLIHEARQLGGFLAELPDVRSRNLNKVQSIISNTVKKNPQFKIIIITDADGQVWASSSPFTPPVTLAHRRHFKNARSTGSFSSGEYIVGNIAKQPIFALAYPIIDNNSFRGVITISLDLDVLKSILGRSQLPPDSNYVLTDHRGIIISRGVAIGKNVGEPIQSADLKKMQDGPERYTYEFTRNDGDRRIVTYRKLFLPGESSPYIYVRAGVSINSALANANKQLLLNVSIMASFALLALMLALVIGKRSIVDRVSTLRSAAQRIAAGDLHTRISDQLSGGELGELGCVFDDMAKTLEQNIAQLNESQQLLHEKARLLEDEIAERQVAQEELADKQRLLELLNHTLETRIESAVAELRQKDQALIQQNRLASMGEMINNIAHQWRQPLNLIGLIIQGLPHYPDLTQEALDQEVDKIMNIILHMSQTIDDFRYFFHTGKTKSTFTANQAVAKAVTFITPSLHSKEIRISITEQRPVTIEGFSNEYSQVLLIVLSNAKDALVDRKVADPSISIEIEENNGRSLVTITDNGGGISDDVLPKIFDPYFTTKDKAQGTGIGLYMAKIIIEQHMGGSLTAHNVADGVAFRIEV